LMHEYSICTQGTSQACNPDEGVRAWREVEMYACQLLIPTVREHHQCFGKQRDAQCEVKFNKDCSESALEMLQPIIDESEEITSSLRCRSLADVPAPQSTSAPRDEAAVAPPMAARKVSSDAVVTSSTTARTIGPVVQITSAEEIVATSTVPVLAKHGAPALKINMSDAVNSLYYIYDICSSDYTKSPYSSVAVKLCTKQDDIAKHSDCYQNTLEKEKCAMREAKNECEALEAFNANLDCAIVTMNDICEVEAQNTVIEIQEAINDAIIEKKCFDDREKIEKQEKPSDPNEFHLETKMTPCTDEQENGALACLVELLEINKQLTQFQNLNFLLEIASENSSVVSNICELYGKYDKCLNVSVFTNKQRCGFASPLNTLARIGLSPICSAGLRPLFATHRDCLMKLAGKADAESNCQNGLSGIGNTVGMMMQGIHGEALLCKSFYIIRDTFTCGEKAVERLCSAKALEDLGTLKRRMTEVGEEEGCPREPPANLDEIIARPVKRPTPIPIP
uniref:DUF19 domain-containing protein n=1 Tax=Heligmosomoides polygyrus TaxID=6339 RepID=A0A183GTT4_HELPZ